MKLAKYSTKFSKKQIILLSIPVFFSNLAIPMVGIVDTGLMGNLGETKYLAATSIATSVMTMVIWSFGFLRMGTVGIVSQAYGRGDYREIVRTLLRNFVIAMVIALLIIILKPLINISIQHFFNTSQKHKINKYLFKCKSFFCSSRIINLYFSRFLSWNTKNKDF
jgi:MATE family multidrug resistance protein